ncbi:hypothetical protein L226DRAFT_617227 [Lentinus tigrinus ALCF2SS1-7]|uniref:Uncharacterized protein n=1 Tax=Lentinus tigrinus ALCF2SS1-6 TaxID=1328759 RepID=A0A5C2RU68_9APHY|nr:hypothetical protein L227DRAFT_657795 [Lentinus tigrinus ALCF2SS1-6]RPD68870.1 hypothetical protein L226DRAFT_617227 [Lentinus tigrinus ALCF2SS1-7]
MSTLFRRRSHSAWYNIQTQEYIGLRRGLPVAAPISGHQAGEVGYLKEGVILTIPRNLTSHSGDKFDSPLAEHSAKDTTSEEHTICQCSGAGCGAKALDDDDASTLCESDPAGDSLLAVDVRHDIDFVQLQMEDGTTLNGFVVFPNDHSKETAADQAHAYQDAPDMGSYEDSDREGDDTRTLCSSEAAGPSNSSVQLSVDDVRRLFKDAPRWNAWANSVEGDGPGLDVQLKDMVLICGVDSTWVRNTDVTPDRLEAALTAHATSNNIPLNPKSPDVLDHLDMTAFADRTWFVHEQAFVHFYKLRRRRCLHTYIRDVAVRAWDNWLWEEEPREKHFDPVDELLRYILHRLPFSRMAIASSKDFFAVFEDSATVPTTAWQTRIALWRRMPPVRFIKGTRVAALDIACREIERETKLSGQPNASEKGTFEKIDSSKSLKD